MNRERRVVLSAGLLLLCSAVSAPAQVLGTFRWQFAPFCNVVSVRVEQKGAVYELTGTEDGCSSAAPAATVNGSAHLNAGGSVGMSLAIVRPDGFTVNASVTLDPGTLSGVWRDNWANSGTFVFNPGLPAAGSVRPLTMRGEWSVVFPATGASARSSASISFPHQLPSIPAAPAINIIPAAGAPTANCPGSIAIPLAAPGQVCLYEHNRTNLTSLQMFSAGSGTLNQATDVGFGVLAIAAGAGQAGAYGRWAVTVP